jgi:uncharacterized protein (TIGR02145 family)
MMMKNKMKILTLVVLATAISSQAQKMKIWKSGVATEYNVTTEIDSVTFEGLSSLASSSSNGNLSSSLVQSSSSQLANTITDSRDAKVYKTIVIGTQTWMAENLNFGTYVADSNSSVQYQLSGQKFCYGNTTSNCDAEGGLYQWHTAMGLAKVCSDGNQACSSQINNGNHQGICPVGWHIPKNPEWATLVQYLGGVSVAGDKMKDVSFNGTNSSGFSALGTGFRGSNGGFFNQTSTPQTYYWEAVETSADYAHYQVLKSDRDELTAVNYYKRFGYSVRCLKD